MSLMEHPDEDAGPQRRLGPCPSCGLTILAERWEVVGAAWRPVGARTSPALRLPA